MPLQHINVSPVNDINKEIEGSFTDTQMYIRANKSEDAYGRSESQSSSQTSTSVEICRICHCEGDAEGGLITPCYCSGSLRYVHQTCLQQWIKSSNIRCCELCKFQFIMHTKTKPFTEVPLLGYLPWLDIFSSSDIQIGYSAFRSLCSSCSK